jgi:hypothetical protein
MSRRNMRRRSPPAETPYNTRFDGVVESLTRRGTQEMANITVLSDTACTLSVPLSRVPKGGQCPGTPVRIFLTAMHGKFGIVCVDDEERRQPAVPNRDVV